MDFFDVVDDRRRSMNEFPVRIMRRACGVAILGVEPPQHMRRFTGRRGDARRMRCMSCPHTEHWMLKRVWR